MNLGMDKKVSPEELIAEITKFKIDFSKDCMDCLASIYLLMLIYLIEYFHKVAKFSYKPLVDTLKSNASNEIGTLEINKKSNTAKYTIFLGTNPRKKIEQLKEIYSVSQAMAILIGAVELLEQNIQKEEKTANFSPAVAELLTHRDENRLSIQDVIDAINNRTIEVGIT